MITQPVRVERTARAVRSSSNVRGAEAVGKKPSAG